MSSLATPIAIAVVVRGSWVLVGQRPQGVPLAGYAEFPGGKVEPGETPADAAVRECREETGLDVRVVRLFDAREHTYTHGKVSLHFFLCEPRDANAELPPPYRWVERTQLDHLAFPEANQHVIQQLTSARPEEKAEGSGGRSMEGEG